MGLEGVYKLLTGGVHVYFTPFAAALELLVFHAINQVVLNGLKGLHALCTVSLNGTFKKVIRDRN